MELRPIAEADATSFLRQQPPHSGWFLQTPSWASLVRAEGGSTEQVGFWERGELVGTAMVALRQLPGSGHYAYAPAGPVLVNASHLAEALELMVKHYGGRAWFLRLEPRLAQVGFGRGWVQARDVQPRATLTWDLTRTPEELLAAMHEKTRYNVRLAERKGLEWRWGGLELYDDFWGLLQATAERDGFAAHEPAHYRTLVEMFGGLPVPGSELSVRLAGIYLQGRPLAVNLLVLCHGAVTYLHGASAGHSRNLMAPYQLHWRSALTAKAKGFKLYDWWGVEPERGPASPGWAGFTRFKTSFGGERLEYAGTFDFPYSMLRYRWYRTGRRLRHILKR